MKLGKFSCVATNLKKFNLQKSGKQCCTVYGECSIREYFHVCVRYNELKDTAANLDLQLRRLHDPLDLNLPK